ncbi:hypothetical protein Asal01_00798 [Fodinibius salicampi]
MTKLGGSTGITMPSRFSLLLFIFLFFESVGYSQSQEKLKQDIISLDKIKSSIDNNNISSLKGDTVTVTGIANISTGLLHENYLQVFIQNDSTGISLFSVSYNKTINHGDSIVATGVIQDYYGLTEINVSEYSVFPTNGKQPPIIPLFQAVDSPQRFEGMLVNGTGNVVRKGDRFNGKYIMVAPYNKPDKSMMVYVTNFHSMYQQFDFESLSVGDEVRITGVLSLYNPDSKGEEESTYKIHLRTPNDLTPIGFTQSQVTLWGSMGLLLVLLVIGWIISLRSSVKNKTEDLQESLNDKEILLKEIHHRIKNNLAIMSGLFELQLEGVENAETQKVLRDSQSRLKSMALVHDKLYRTSTLTDIEMSQYITELVRSLRNTFAGTNQEIDLEFDLDDISLDIDQAIPCGLLINEIVVNAFKHAFNNKKTGVINISLKRQGETIQLVIADNGEGIPDDIDLENRSSLGMMLIDTFKKQLEATMEITNTNGTRYSISFPIEE